MKRIYLLAITLFVIGLTSSAQSPDYIWAKTYGGNNSDYAYSIQQIFDSGYIVSGYVGPGNLGDVHGNHGGHDFWVIKLDYNGDTIWTKCFGGTSYDHASSIQQTFDSGYIVAGGSKSNNGDVFGNHGENDFWVIKLDVDGEKVWANALGGSNTDYAHSIQQTYDSGYIVAGSSGSTNGDVHGNHGGTDLWVVKLNNNGDTLWTKCYGGSGDDYAQSIQQTFDSGFIVAGYANSIDGDVHGNGGNYDYWLVRLDSGGDTLWTKTLGGSNIDRAYSVQQTIDSGFIVAGYTGSTDGDVQGNHGGFDYWIVKLNSTGDTVWTNTYGGSSSEEAYSIQQTYDSGFIVTGFSWSDDGDAHGNHGGKDYYVVKLDSLGSVIWTVSLGGSASDVAQSVQQTYDSNYIIAGYTRSNDGDVYGNHSIYDDFWVVKLDAETCTCASPSVLNRTNITDTSVALGWTENGSATAWQLMLDTSGFDTVGCAPVSVMSNPYTWGGLTQNTTYDWYVRADCGGGDQSYWRGERTFTTVYDIQPAPFSEDFAADTIPEFWSMTGQHNWLFSTDAGDGAAEAGDHTTGGGTNYAWLDAGSLNGTLFTPYINVSTLNTPSLMFWYFSNNTSEANDTPLIVELWDGSSWQTIFNESVSNTHWQRLYFDLSAYSVGDVVRFKFSSRTSYHYTGNGDLLIDDVLVDEYPACLPVGCQYENITDGTVHLEWTEIGSATIWQIMLDTAGFDTATATHITLPVNYYTWTGLTEGETYDWYVRSDCGDGDYSIWTGPKTFTFPVTNFPWLEGFEHGGNSPLGWTNEPEEEDWTYINGDGGAGSIENAHSGAYNAFFNDGSNIKLVTPPLDLTGLTNPVLSFWNTQVWQYGPHNSIFQDELTVYYKTSFTGEWTQIPIQDYLFCPFDWIEEYCIPLPNPGATYYIAFQGNNWGGSGICLDDILVEDLPSCLRPSELIEHISVNQIKLNWTEMGSATSWQIMLDTAGFDTATATPITVTNSFYQSNNLTEKTAYNWYVRSDCGAGDFSRWTIPETFVFESNPFVFRNTLGGMDNESAYSIQQTYDSGFVVAGYTESTDGDVHANHGSSDFWVVKLDDAGDTLWTKCLGGSSSESAHSIQQTFDSGYIVTGSVGYNSNYWVVKLNSIGDTIWTKHLGGSNDEKGESIQQTYDSGFVVAGYSRSNNGDVHGNHGNYDFWVVKLSKHGDTLWTKCLGGSNDDRAFSIQQTYDSGYIVVGFSWSNDGDVHGNHGGRDFWVVKVNNLGAIVWAKTFGGSADDAAYAVQQTYDSGYVVAGYTYSNDGNVLGNHGGSDFWVIKLNNNGNTLWTKVLGGSESEIAYSIQQTLDSGFVIAGSSSSNNGDVHGHQGNSDFWVVKLNSTGDTLWTKTLGGSDVDRAYAVQETFNSEYIIAGYTYSNDGDVFGNHGNSDFWVVELAEFPNHIYQDIQLSNGWNILSFNVTPNDTNMLHIMQPLIDSSELVKVIDEAGNIIQDIPGIGWMNTIGNMANTEGYYTKVNVNTQLQTTGLPVALPFTIPLTTGWNILGYPLQESQDAQAAVQSLIDDDELIKVLDESGGFIQDIPGIGWMNTIGDFEAGKGYYIKVIDNTSLTLDNPPILFIGSPPIVQKQPQLFNVPKQNPYLPMNIIVTGINIEGYTLQNDDEVAVFDNNRLTGAGVITTGNKALTSFAAALDDPTTTEIDGYIEGNIPAFRFKSANLNESVQLRAKPVFGDLIFSPLGTLVCTLEGSLTAIEQKKEKIFALKCIPNPANNYTNIQYQLPEEGQLQLEVYDLSSHRIKILQSEQQSAGSHTYRFDATLLERGIYLIKIQLRTNDNQFTEVVKFVKN